MGLDNFWKKSKDEAGVIEGEFKICGGIFSGNGSLCDSLANQN